MKRIYIIGSGNRGISIAKEILKNKGYGKTIAFIDNNETKIGKTIEDIPVLGPIQNIIDEININLNNEFIICISSKKKSDLKKIYDLLISRNFKNIKIAPTIDNLLNAHLVQTRDIKPEDLLFRETVKIDLKRSLSYLKNKRVLITGSGGSIGSELARQLLYAGVQRLYLLGHGENSIYLINKELKELQSGGVGEKTNIVPIIGELQDKNYLNYLFSNLKADVVFHTAAYKHVPLMEDNPVAVIQNNVFGTLNLINSCIKFKVKSFVLISTDKVVKPSSIYGISKNLCEKIILQKENENIQCRIVRFGNVLGSRGSIVPLFKKQILSGGPVTITHTDMKRFFMSIPEAVSLVLKIGGIIDKKKLFLLDMGDPIYIKDLVLNMIKFFNYENKIEFKYIGIRKGEKLFEELYDKDHEIIKKTEHEGINHIIIKDKYDFNLDKILKKLYYVCFYEEKKKDHYRNKEYLIKLLNNIYKTEKE